VSNQKKTDEYDLSYIEFAFKLKGKYSFFEM